jgi:metal-responsive CopG/Arc/MetJ family transcriptional regulator
MKGAEFVTPQGVSQKYGRNRETRSERIIDALRTYLAGHARPLYVEVMGTFVAVYEGC